MIAVFQIQFLAKNTHFLNRVYDDIDAVSASSPLQTSVRNAIVESQQVLSKEDFLKLMLPDSLPMEEGRRKVGYFLWLYVFQSFSNLRNGFLVCPKLLYRMQYCFVQAKFILWEWPYVPKNHFPWGWEMFVWWLFIKSSICLCPCLAWPEVSAGWATSL